MDRGDIERVEVVTEDGERVDITDMPEDEYETFLELMHRVRAAYIARKNVIQSSNRHM